MKKIRLKKIKLSRIKKRATASAVAGATVLGIVLGSTFDSPAELLERELLSSRPAVTDVLISDSADDDSGDDDAALAGEEKKKNLRARFKEQVMAMPYYVRACVGLPLWCLGWLILSAAGHLWEPVLSPLLSVLVNALCVGGIVAAALISTVKTAFPEMPIKKILNRRSLSTVFIGALLFGIAGALMQLFWPEYERLRNIAEGGIMLAVLTAAAVPLLRREARRRRRAAQIALDTVPGKNTPAAVV